MGTAAQGAYPWIRGAYRAKCDRKPWPTGRGLCIEGVQATSTQGGNLMPHTDTSAKGKPTISLVVLIVRHPGHVIV